MSENEFEKSVMAQKKCEKKIFDKKKCEFSFVEFLRATGTKKSRPKTMSEDSGDENIMEDIAQDVREFVETVGQRIRIGVRRGYTEDLRESVKFRLLRSLFNERTLTFDKEVDAFELSLLHEAIEQLNLQADFVCLDFDLNVVDKYTRLDDGSVQLEDVARKSVV